MFLPSQSPHTQLLLDFFKVHFLFLFKILSVSNLSSASVFGVTSAQIVSLPSNKNGCLSSVPASFQNKITDCAKIFILLHTFFSLINHKEPRKEKFLTKKNTSIDTFCPWTAWKNIRYHEYLLFYIKICVSLKNKGRKTMKLLNGNKELFETQTFM